VVGGIVHDTSQSGQTVFVEPPAAVEAGNRIRELEARSARSASASSRELTDLLRPEREALADAWDALVTLDSLYGRARYALAAKCSPMPTLAAGARRLAHPRRPAPAAARAGRGRGGVRAGDVSDERTLLVSGPNTGGKTVLLKALALIALMMQCGMPAPVGAESTVPVLRRRLRRHRRRAIARGLALHLLRAPEAPEGDRGPRLGGRARAHRRARLRHGSARRRSTRRGDPRDAHARGTTTIATTHLGALKELASEVPGVVNASLQFDAERLAPTYRLIKGIPGRSYGLAIAQRLAMSADGLARAEERVPRWSAT
jgi:DNA mismatch repair protein MutS2